MNNINLIGRLTRDPEPVEGTETPLTRMRLAVSGKTDDDTLFIDVVAFTKLATSCAEHLSKGRQVAVTGKLRYREWETDEGSRRSAHSVIADRVDFLG